MEVDRRNRSLLVLDGTLGGDLVAALASGADGAAFEAQDLGRGRIRPRLRATVDDGDLADRLWDALGVHLPAPADWFDDAHPPPSLDLSIEHWNWNGLNQRLRWYRYEPGAEFSPHVDEPWWPDPRRRSLLTLLVALPAGGCVGGETVVGSEVIPVLDGRVTVFDHRLLHSGRPVEQGAKVVLRTDVVASAD